MSTPQKPQGLKVGRVVPPQTLEAVTGNGVDGWGLAEKPHASTTRVSVPTFRNPVRSPQARSAGMEKPRVPACPPEAAPTGLGAGGPLLLFRGTKLSAFSSPGWKGRRSGQPVRLLSSP